MTGDDSTDDDEQADEQAARPIPTVLREELELRERRGELVEREAVLDLLDSDSLLVSPGETKTLKEEVREL